MLARFSLLVVATALTLGAVSASAAWDPNGVTIKSTTTEIPEVVAVRGLEGSAIVVWREGGGADLNQTGVLRAQHVLATGDLDPSWPADGAMICDTPVNATSFQIVADGMGGAYFAWLEGSNCRLTRITAGGAIAPGWPTRGRLLGGVYPVGGTLMTLISDGVGGLYAAGAFLFASNDLSGIRLFHIRPDDTDAPGYPSTGQMVVGGDPITTWDIWASLALAPDGGVYLEWASRSEDPGVVPSAVRLTRLTSSGTTSPGWPAGGVVLAPFPNEYFAWDPYSNSPSPHSSLTGLVPDGAGGVLSLFPVLTYVDTPTQFPPYEFRLQRFSGGGVPDPAWPVTGRLLTNGVYDSYSLPASERIRLLPDGLGGVQLGMGTPVIHSTSYRFLSCSPARSWAVIPGPEGLAELTDAVVNGAGGVFLSDGDPVGVFGSNDGPAYIRVQQSDPPPGWSDLVYGTQADPELWYPDVALCESGDGGAILFWSQVRGQFGLFAKKFDGSGEVTGISPPIRVRALDIVSLRFVAGEGVRASLSIPDGESATLDLFDVSGRRVASSAIASTDAGRPLTIGGTRALSSGLYFARLATSKASATGKAVVAR